MNELTIRGALRGATIGSIGGAITSWLISLASIGLQPLVFVTCGVYAGIACGGILGAVNAARHQPKPALAFTSKTRRR